MMRSVFSNCFGFVLIFCISLGTVEKQLPDLIRLFFRHASLLVGRVRKDAPPRASSSKKIARLKQGTYSSPAP